MLGREVNMDMILHFDKKKKRDTEPSRKKTLMATKKDS
jgi:hypothetical protein